MQLGEKELPERNARDRQINAEFINSYIPVLSHTYVGASPGECARGGGTDAGERPGYVASARKEKKIVTGNDRAGRGRSAKSG